MHRRRFLTVLGTGAVAASIGGFGTANALAAPGRDRRSVWSDRAVQSYDALQKHLYRGELYLEKYPLQDGDLPYSYLWPVREAAAATIDLTRMVGAGGTYDADVEQRFAALSRYWDAGKNPPGYASYVMPPHGNGGDLFYDDNAIVGLEHIREFRRKQQAGLLDQARTIMTRTAWGWDSDASHPQPGGVFWVDANWTRIRAANATGLAAQLAAHLYELTKEQHYLDWAIMAYDWNRSTLRSPEGLYWNSIDLDGGIDRTLWIYNSGIQIGASAVIHRATGDRAFLVNAQNDFEAAYAYWQQDDRYHDQPAVFNAIFGKNLLLLHSLAPDERLRQTVEEYADLTWQRNRDPELGLFRFPPSGGGPYDPNARPETLAQSAMIQLFAVLAWPNDQLGEAA